MLFDKINDKTIRCWVTSKELDSHGVGMKDFIENNKSAEQLINLVLKKSAEELGYSIDSTVLSINIVPADKGGVIITFSDASEEIEDLMGIIYNITKILKERPNIDEKERNDLIKQLLESEFMKNNGKLFDDFDVDKIMTDLEENVEKSRDKRSLIPDRIGFYFDSLKDLEKYCKVLTDNGYSGDFNSDLYFLKEKKSYYISIETEKMETAVFKQILKLGLEYSKHISINVLQDLVMMEHEMLVIKDKAIDSIAKMR